MDPIKSVGRIHLRNLISGATQVHADMHGGITHHSLNSKERRAVRQQELESQLRLNPALGKGGA